LIKQDKPYDNQKNGYSQACKDHVIAYRGGSKKPEPEKLYGGADRVGVGDPAETPGDFGKGVYYRGRVHGQAYGERYKLTQIPVLGGQGRYDNSRPYADGGKPDDEQGEEKHKQRRPQGGSDYKIIYKKHHQHDKLNHNFDAVAEYIVNRNDKARKINLPENIRVIDKYIGRIGKAAGKKRPEHGSGIIKKGIGNAVRSDIGKPSKYKSVHYRGNKGAYNIPQGSQDGLLVLGYKVPFYKEKNQVPVTDYFPDPQIKKFPPGSDY
jgi:hypothetical protein